MLGIGAAAPIGPVNVEIARRTLLRGFAAGFALGCGAVTIDVTYAVLSSFAFRAVLDYPRVLRFATIAGLLLLVYLGVLSLWSVAAHLRKDPLARPVDENRPLVGSSGWAYLTGLLMTLLNPMTLLFWFTVVPATAGTSSNQPVRLLPVLCAGVFLATIAWVTAFSGTLAWAGRYRRNWWLAAADALGGGMLLMFAAAGFWHLHRLPL